MVMINRKRNSFLLLGRDVVDEADSEEGEDDQNITLNHFWTFWWWKFLTKSERAQIMNAIFV